MCSRPMLAAVACALLAPGLTTVALADRPHPDPNVAGLQTALAVKGFYRGPIDGLRGPLTTAALRALQRQFRLPSSNLIDRRLRAVLRPLGRPRYRTRVLQKGMVGLDVAALQFELRYHGFPTPEDGNFNDRTQPTTRWQSRRQSDPGFAHRCRRLSERSGLVTQSNLYVPTPAQSPPASAAPSSLPAIAREATATPSSPATQKASNSSTLTLRA
jgi:Putative peptidoglycan binding domain